MSVYFLITVAISDDKPGVVKKAQKSLVAIISPQASVFIILGLGTNLVACGGLLLQNFLEP